MAFADTGRDYFVSAGPANRGPRRWTFKTADATATIDTAGYFNAVGDLVRVGDTIEVQIGANIGASNETVTSKNSYVVNSRSLSAGSYTVDVTNATEQTMTDSD